MYLEGHWLHNRMKAGRSDIRNRCLNSGEPMTFEVVVSIATLAGFIWAVRFMLPKALKEHDSLALASAVLTAVVALLAWLLIGVGVR